MHVRRSRLCNHPGPPPLTQTTFLACCAHYPGGPIRADGYRFERAPAPGSFRIDSAFPAKAPGRHPHCSFRGLLKLYSRYGPPSCSPTFRGLCREVPARPVSRPNRSPAIESNHQLFEWVLPPLVICPLGAHALAPVFFTRQADAIRRVWWFFDPAPSMETRRGGRLTDGVAHSS